MVYMPHETQKFLSSWFSTMDDFSDAHAHAVPHGRPHSLPRKSQETEDAAAAAVAFMNASKKRKTAHPHHAGREEAQGLEEPAVPSAAWQEVPQSHMEEEDQRVLGQRQRQQQAGGTVATRCVCDQLGMQCLCDVICCHSLLLICWPACVCWLYPNPRAKAGLLITSTTYQSRYCTPLAVCCPITGPRTAPTPLVLPQTLPLAPPPVALLRLRSTPVGAWRWGQSPGSLPLPPWVVLWRQPLQGCWGREVHVGM
jgi:hypothetical protein